VISLRNIEKHYRAESIETAALAQVSLEIQEGEFIAVMGPSGCGKSTLLNILGMIDSPSAGEYLFCGQDVAPLPERELVELRKVHLGFIFQSFNLIDELTVYENIELPLLYQNVSRARRRERVREVLELVDLQARANHRPAQLSGGQQQRVAVARAVVTDPKLILADEPTGNLDTKNGDEVMEMLATLNREGATVLMVTHSATYAEWAHRIVYMLDGRIVSHAEGKRHSLEAVGNA
jgi:putative ABC transport system ATP-binding protein